MTAFTSKTNAQSPWYEQLSLEWISEFINFSFLFAIPAYYSQAVDGLTIALLSKFNFRLIIKSQFFTWNNRWSTFIISYEFDMPFIKDYKFIEIEHKTKISSTLNDTSLWHARSFIGIFRVLVNFKDKRNNSIDWSL